MRIRVLATNLLWLAAFLLCCQGQADAATYQLQVASVSERVFMHFAKGQTLPRIEAYLDTPRSTFVLLRDRQPQALELVGPGTEAPFLVNVAASKRKDPWGVTTWDAEVGQLAVFRIRGKQSDHQKLRRVAVYTNGAMTRFSVAAVPASQSQRIPVPAVAAAFLTHALHSDAFIAWAERRAVSYNGLSVIVGKHHDTQESDTVYLVVRLPESGRAYKVILGWKTVKRDGTYNATLGVRN